MFWTSVVPAFLSSLVEFVEALTVVLAVGVSVNWRSALTGALAAAAVLAGLVVGLGAAIVTYIPLEAMRLVIGLLLILFGAQWLKKALLRSSGMKSLRDESALFQKHLKEAEQAAVNRGRFSPYGFAASFKSVLLEGLEVAFIVLTFGASASGLWAAAEGALAALAVVIALGLLLHQPLSKVPENLLKFSVGWMLLTFGLFWTGEGLGIEWPLADLFLLVLGAITLGLCWGLHAFLTGRKNRGFRSAPEPKAPRAWWARVPFEIFDFFCGDWWMLGGTAIVAVAAAWLPLGGATLLAGVLAAFVLAVLRSTVRQASASV
jgi:uncharacterized membrane protein